MVVVVAVAVLLLFFLPLAISQLQPTCLFAFSLLFSSTLLFFLPLPLLLAATGHGGSDGARDHGGMDQFLFVSDPDRRGGVLLLFSAPAGYVGVAQTTLEL